MSVSSVLVGQAAILTFTAYDDGTQTDLGTVTVGIVDANGTQIVAPGTAVTDNSDGTYNYTLAKQTQPKFLTVTWTVTGGPIFTTYVDVQGSQLFHEAQLRSFDDALLTASQYSDALIAEAHQYALEKIEAETGRSHIRRYNRMVLPGTGSRILDLSAGYSRDSVGFNLIRPGAHQDIIRVLSADDGATITVGDIQISDGRLHRVDASWTQSSTDDPFNVTIEYEYGLPYPAAGAARVAMLLAQHYLKSSRIPGSAASFTDSLGSYSFDETRLPFEAWQWLKANRTVIFA